MLNREAIIDALEPQLMRLARVYAEYVALEAKDRAPVGSDRARPRPGKVLPETFFQRQIEARRRRRKERIPFIREQEAIEAVAAHKPIPARLREQFKAVVTRGAYKGREVNPETGRLIPRSGSAKRPGGWLRASIKAMQPFRTNRGVTVFVEARAPHARYVEFGTYHPVGPKKGQPKQRPYRIPPRPFLLPALHSLRKVL